MQNSEALLCLLHDYCMVMFVVKYLVNVLKTNAINIFINLSF